jgi:hypothetical protein
MRLVSQLRARDDGDGNTELTSLAAERLTPAPPIRATAPVGQTHRHDFRVFARGGDGRPRLLDVREVLDATVKLTLNELRHRARLVKHYDPVPLVTADEARSGSSF